MLRALAGGLEFDFPNARFEPIVESLLTSGCALLRNFAEASALTALKEALEEIYRENSRDGKSDPHIFAADFRSRGLPEFHEWVFEPRHRALLNAIFGKDGFSVFHGTHSRRVSPPTIPTGQAWTLPLAPHLDACIHDMEYTVNFWVPLEACGVDRPSLGVVPTDYARTQGFSGYDGRPAVAGPDGEWNFPNFAPLMLALSSGNQAASQQFYDVFQDRLWTPAFALGDALLISNWTLHFTHHTPQMRFGRTSVELRFLGKKSLDDVLAAHARHRGQGLSRDHQP